MLIGLSVVAEAGLANPERNNGTSRATFERCAPRPRPPGWSRGGPAHVGNAILGSWRSLLSDPNDRETRLTSACGHSASSAAR